MFVGAFAYKSAKAGDYRLNNQRLNVRPASMAFHNSDHYAMAFRLFAEPTRVA